MSGSPSSSSLQGILLRQDDDFDHLSDITDRLTFSDQAYNADIESPNDMQLDSEEFLNDAEAEKDDADVAIIHPDEALPRADDCRSRQAH